MKQRLTDIVPFEYRVEENKAGQMIVRGIFQRGGVQNENRRRYPTEVLRKAIHAPEFQEAMNGQSLFGELDHPGDGETRLSRSSHFIPEVQVTEEGTVIGKAVIMETSRGKDLKEIFRSGARVGISSRGSGSLAQADDGVDEVQEDFVLDTFDFVAAPSTPGAYPRVVNESKKKDRRPTMNARDRFHTLREQAQQLLSQKPSLMTESVRKGFKVEAEGVEIELNRLAEEDAGYKTLCKELVEKLSKKRRTLESRVAPPPVEKIVQASEAVMAELVRQLQEQKTKSRRRVAEIVAPLRKALRRKMAEVTTTKRHLSAAYAVGEEVTNRLESVKVQGHVDKLVAENPRLRPVREALKKCSTVEEANKFARRILESKPKAAKRRPRRRVRRRVEGRQPALARRGAPNISTPLTERAGEVDAMVRQGDRLRLGKRLNLQY
jgi:hypothetical protein